MASDNDDDKDGDDDANNEDVEVVEIGTGEALTTLDRLANLKDLWKEEGDSLSAMKDKRYECWTKSKAMSMIILC